MPTKTTKQLPRSRFTLTERKEDHCPDCGHLADECVCELPDDFDPDRPIGHRSVLINGKAAAALGNRCSQLGIDVQQAVAELIRLFDQQAEMTPRGIVLAGRICIPEGGSR